MNLRSIQGIHQSALELLEAAGFSSIESLARISADDLWNELKRANSILHIAEEDPELSAVKDWVSQARALVPQEVKTAQNDGKSAEADKSPVDYEHSLQYASMLSLAPCALPLPGRILAEQQLGVAEIPSGVLLNQYSGEIDIRTSPRLPGNMQPRLKPNASSGDYIRLASGGGQRLEIDSSRLRSTNDSDFSKPVVSDSNGNPSPAKPDSPRRVSGQAQENKHAKPVRRARGVLHSHPVSIYMGAVFTSLLFTLIPLAIASSVLLLLSGESPNRFGWVPEWVIVFPLLIPVFGVLYLFVAFGGNCRVCGQGFFRHRQHRKHPKAHHFPGLGYIFPLSLRILFFLRFRCTHCGTVISLKE